MEAKVISSAPTYDAGQQQPLTQDTAGRLRVLLEAASTILGKVGIDQTTPGTTDSVTVATGQGAGAAIGATSGAAVITDANGTIQQYLRGLVKRWVDALGAGTAAAALRTTLASDDPAVATLGATTGAAVITDANGTVQQYLRGLVKRWVDALGAGTAAAALRVVVATDQTAIAVDQTKQSSLINSVAISSFTRPTDTNPYAVGDLVANNVTAASVTRLSWTGATIAGGAGTGEICGLHIYSSASVAQTLRAHFFSADPSVPNNGDNGALSVAALTNYIGYVDVVLPANALNANGSSGYTGGVTIPYKIASGDTIYALLEAQSIFTPGNAAVYAVAPRFRRYS